MSIGWEGGVYVQTCGHTLHIDCHKSYMESLRVSKTEDLSCLFGSELLLLESVGFVLFKSDQSNVLCECTEWFSYVSRT